MQDYKNDQICCEALIIIQNKMFFFLIGPSIKQIIGTAIFVIVLVTLYIHKLCITKQPRMEKEL